MAGNGGATNGGAGAGAGSATISAASTAIASADTTRFQPQPPHHRRNRWKGCFGGLACFGSQKTSKRIVPAARTPGGTIQSGHVNSSQPGATNQTTTLNLSLLAPPSSPASFSNSALPSTAQSPSCFLSLSANSPGGPTNMMFATGPYAHETQLVSPPVFSTFTTEPSTAPLTPPPELAQLTTPSSPDVPFARFLSSSMDLRTAAVYIPGSPSSSLISPASVTPRTGLSSPLPEQEPVRVHPVHWSGTGSALSSGHASPYYRNSSSKLFGLDPAAGTRNFISAPESPFFRPAVSPQFCLDQAQQSPLPYARGRPSLSREGDGHSKNVKQEVEEIEAYRASFGFSADEIITMQNYTPVAEAADESFTMCPFANGTTGSSEDGSPVADVWMKGDKVEKVQSARYDIGDKNLQGGENVVANSVEAEVVNGSTSSLQDVHPFVRHKEENLPESQELSKRATRPGQSCSDAEIDYRRARSLREATGILAWRNSLP
ncbi:hydroxyproline-rich glycoprotein family protein [Rhynchospora pubera]|uniref:Hydroxyproline-rich glycoprotein family protein n=1 Tax=Rhynchospora pubera TaxID=906938 RepID=A0AAV8FQG0_9POAL|nr:hydroxyproline-rich glycoprotein family protein [Rhynchospora pubera]KAJ4793974.1 hydroxyproline-rich glycoprotein family protein [Rhynchospora pubera]